MCGETTRRFLFNFRELDIPICSRKCEYGYIETLPPKKKEQIMILNYLNEQIRFNKLFKKIGWTIAGCGLSIVIIGFLLKNASIFILGNLPMAGGALSTVFFADQINKLTILKKRIVI